MLNPIETAFSKAKNSVKELLRSCTDGSLSDYILMFVSNVIENDCIGYFRNMSRNLVNCAGEVSYTHQ